LVIWRAEDSDELSTAEELIAIFDDLVSSAYQIDVVLLQELLDHGFAESVANASVVLSPTDLALLWI